jgi:hypothetical protein
MEDLIKNADLVICKTKSVGKTALGYNSDNGTFKKLGPFLEVVEDWDEDDIQEVYLYMEGQYKAVPLSKFKGFYKAVKSLVA